MTDEQTTPKRRPGTYIKPETILRVMNSFSRFTFDGMRTRAIIVVMYRAGLRVSEAVSLMRRDIDRKNSMIRIMHGKGDKYRTVAMDQGWDILEEWGGERHRLKGKTRETPYFCKKNGKAVTRLMVWTALSNSMKKLGITERIHPHAFRHSHAFELASEGVPLHIIQKQLGHASLSRTQKYIDHLCPTDVRDEILKRRVWVHG